jgi:hypothetical protein
MNLLLILGNFMNLINIKISLSLILALSTLSCTSPIYNNFKENKENLSNKLGKYQIKGIADFGKKFNTKANIAQIGDSATVSLIYPYNDLTNPNVTIATGLTDSSGNFSIDPNFTPELNKIYVLEASKRIGFTSQSIITIRTYLKWNGSVWESITSSGININANTTAITIIDYYENSINPNDTINTIVSGSVSAIGGISTTTINDVSTKVTSLISMDTDPVKFIGVKSFFNSFLGININFYYITKEESFNKTYLLQNKVCQNCDLTREDLSNIDLSASNITNSNLNNSDLSKSNLTNVNFTNSNLTNAKLDNSIISNTNFSGATWIDGITNCFSSSIDKCYFPDNLVNSYTTDSQMNPSISMDSNGNFVISWKSTNQDGNANGVYAQRYNNLGQPQGSEFRVNSYTTDSQMNPSISMDSNGNFVISWESSRQDGSGYGVYAQRYNNLGQPQGSEFRVNSYTTDFQMNPSISMDSNGNFVISWESSSQDGNANGVYAQRYNNLGQPQGSEFRVNSYTTYSQMNSSISMDSNGNFVISWESRNQDGSGYGVYAQRYNNLGQPQSSEFRVNSYTTDSQMNPSISMDSNGNFVISWESRNQDGSGYGVYAQRYNNLGQPQGSEFRVNSYTTNPQMNSSISMDSNGNFVISWESRSQDGNANGVYAQRYNNLGQPQGSEFRVNSYTTNPQMNSSISMDSNGNFVISWESMNQDGNVNGVYMHKYNSNGEYIK